MITLLQLYKRDKGICHICDKKVERLSDATREHKIPKVYGGTNKPDNIALAHRWCNKLKGHKIFRAEQHGTGFVVVSPDNEIASDIYPTYTEAYEIAHEMNKDRLYMYSEYVDPQVIEPDNEIVIIRRVQDRPNG